MGYSLDRSYYPIAFLSKFYFGRMDCRGLCFLDRICMKLLSISFLRTFAALIIINSHCGSLYPISALAKGGALGNSLFFLMSGFLLYPLKLGFSEWIKKRYIRLYIPIFFLGLILIITGGGRTKFI